MYMAARLNWIIASHKRTDAFFQWASDFSIQNRFTDIPSGDSKTSHVVASRVHNLYGGINLRI